MANIAQVHRSRAVLLAAIVAGAARWEPFTDDPRKGEICFDGLRFSTELDKESCPISDDITDLLLAALTAKSFRSKPCPTPSPSR